MTALEMLQLLEAELTEHYQCYHFHYSYTANHPTQPVNVMGNYQPVHHASIGSVIYDIHIGFRQEGNTPKDLLMTNVIRDSNHELAKILHGYTRSISNQFKSNATHGLDELMTEMQLRVSEEQIAQLCKNLKDATWSAYSREFDADVDKALESE